MGSEIRCGVGSRAAHPTKAGATEGKAPMRQSEGWNVVALAMALMLLGGCGGSTRPVPVTAPAPTPPPTRSPSPTPRPTASPTFPPAPSPTPLPTASPTPSPAPTPTMTPPPIGPLAAPSQVQCALVRGPWAGTELDRNGTHMFHLVWQDNSTVEDSFTLEVSHDRRRWENWSFLLLEGQAGVGKRELFCCQFFPEQLLPMYVRMRACRSDGSCSPPSPVARCEVRDGAGSPRR